LTTKYLLWSRQNCARFNFLHFLRHHAHVGFVLG
jgi:hypothetical protein